MNTRFATRLRYRLWLARQWARHVLWPRLGDGSALRLAAAGLMLAASGALWLSMDEAPHVQAVAAQSDSHGSSDAGASQGDQAAEAPRETALEHAKKHMDPTYVCPMHPEIVSDDPEATCPICGMDLVPLENNGEADVVSLDPTIVNALGVKLTKVKRRTLYRRIQSVGYIGYDEDKIRSISLRTDGWIERLAVSAEGDAVKAGDLLFEVYSPTLVNAQEEYLQALALDEGEGELVVASRERLLSLGLDESLIQHLDETRRPLPLVPVHAPQDGVVTRLNVREGDYVKPAKPVVGLADLSSVWLVADVFDHQSEWVKVGQMADAVLPFLPDKVFTGRVDYVYPAIDPRTRSLKVRMRFDNAEGILKPNMYADVTIYASPKRKVLTVPVDAVIRTGRQARVIVHLGEGRFKPVTVRLGIESGNRVEVVSGLEEGQEVVVSSQFLIDSESSLRAALLRLGG